MNDISRRISEKLETMLIEAMMGGPQPKRRQTAIRVYGRSFETVELDDNGSVIESLRCICGASAIMHHPTCPFYCMVT